MRILIRGLPSSGSSWIAFNLAQQKEMVSVIDHWWARLPPKELRSVERFPDLLLKQCITLAIPHEVLVQIFRPDHTVLVARDLDAVRTSLSAKSYANRFGTVEMKIAEYCKLLDDSDNLFDEVIQYETFEPVPITRTLADILWYNCEHSDWCRYYYKQRWHFGNIHQSPCTSQDLRLAEEMQR